MKIHIEIKVEPFSIKAHLSRPHRKSREVNIPDASILHTSLTPRTPRNPRTTHSGKECCARRQSIALHSYWSLPTLLLDLSKRYFTIVNLDGWIQIYKSFFFTINIVKRKYSSVLMYRRVQTTALRVLEAVLNHNISYNYTLFK